MVPIMIDPTMIYDVGLFLLALYGGVRMIQDVFELIVERLGFPHYP